MGKRNFIEKKCCDCRVVFPLSNFYGNKSKKYKDGTFGTDNICKQCQAVRSKKKNTYTKKKKYYDRAKLDPKMMEKYKARDAVQRAIKSGLIQRTACTAQGCDVIEGTQAHHWLGYSKENWLKVLWLCSKHHADSHHNTL